MPFGRQQLSPTWQGDLGIDSVQVPGSGLAMRGQLLKDLNRFLLAEVAAGTCRVNGPGSDAFDGSNEVSVSVASVRIVNSTGFSITVVATLQGTRQTITRTIANKATSLIDFNSTLKNFINIDIRRTDGSQVPPPRSGIPLDRPQPGGYNGKTFTISVSGGYFSVSG